MDQKNRARLQQGRGSDALIAFLAQGFQEKSVIALAQVFREFPEDAHILQSDFTEIA
jgi:hypothetical protein